MRTTSKVQRKKKSERKNEYKRLKRPNENTKKCNTLN